MTEPVSVEFLKTIADVVKAAESIGSGCVLVLPVDSCFELSFAKRSEKE